ncbi:hypothetical protein ALQ25_05619 [Pseudomonas coronafaciens pv. atropurpurea]|nr:hypothetical protein ALQ25_05619 [Pseudomonas coronafaciens pv. atropurpurea]
MSLWVQAFQLAESLTLSAALVPGLLRTGQAFLSRELFVTQAVQLDQPLLLEFQLALLCLMGLELLLCIGKALFKLDQLLRGQRDNVAGLGGQGFQRFFCFLAFAVGTPAELAVDYSVGELFQQFAAFLVICFQERAELTLGKHDGTRELFEVQAQAVFDELFELTLALVAEDLLAVQIGQYLAAGLQLLGRVVACAVGFPAGAVAALIDADEIHLGIPAAGATAQQGARVAGGDVSVDVRDLGLADIAQPRNGPEQRQAQSVEQGTFTRAGRAGDGEQSGTGQRFCGEIQFERTRQRREVFQANGKNFHDCSLSCWTSRSNVAKSVRVCSSTSLP